MKRDKMWISGTTSNSNQYAIGISIVNYHCHDSVRRLIVSLEKFVGEIPTYVAILDNSDDPARSEYAELLVICRRYSSQKLTIEAIRSDFNLGYGAGNNLAVATLLEKGVTLIWVLNPDTRVIGRAANLLREIEGSDADIWATATVEGGLTSHGLGTLSTLTGQGRKCQRAELGKRFLSFEYPAGHSILFRRAAWLRLNGFDERYFLFMEEADLTLRARRQAIGIGTLNSVTVEHDQGLTTGSTQDLAAKSVTAYREATKSRMIFFRRHYPLRLAGLVLARLAYAAIVLAKRNPMGAAAVLNGLLSGARLGPSRRFGPQS